MNLQHSSRSCKLSGDGYAMAALLVAIGAIAVVLSVAMPVWKQVMQREKEAELVFRGEQYARAISLYMKKNGNRLPPSFDVLVQQKFLRKKYKDPITNSDFLPMYGGRPMRPGDTGAVSVAAPGGTTPGGPRPGTPARGGDPPGEDPLIGPGERQARGQMAATSMTVGPISGVVSKSRAQSIRIYRGARRYSDFLYVYVPFRGGLEAGARDDGSATGNTTPGGSKPGTGRPGTNRPGSPIRPPGSGQ